MQFRWLIVPIILCPLATPANADPVLSMNGAFQQSATDKANYFMSSVGVGTTTPATSLQVSGVITSGQASSLGAVVLQGWAGTGALSVWGSERSSGAPIMGYAVNPSATASNSFVSAWAGSSVPRAALNVGGYTQTGTGGGGFTFYTGDAQTVTIGSAVTMTPRMTITNAGNVGIGTTVPTTPLVVNGIGTYTPVSTSYSALGAFAGTTTNRARLVVQNSSTTGSGSATILLAGYDNMYELGTDYNMTGDKGFYIASRSYAGGASTILTITASGLIGMGIYAPSYTLHVNGSVAGTSAYNNLSDIRLKKDVVPIAYGLETLMQMRPVSFNWIKQDQDWKKQHQIGLIAQEVEPLVPEVVTTANDKQKTKSLAYGSLVPVLIKAVQELASVTDNQAVQQNTRLEAMEKEIADLKKQVGGK